MAAKIEAGTVVELCAKIYKREGWIRAEGESKLKRIKQLYDLGIDYKRNRFWAVKK